MQKSWLLVVLACQDVLAHLRVEPLRAAILSGWWVLVGHPLLTQCGECLSSVYEYPLFSLSFFRVCLLVLHHRTFSVEETRLG